MSEKKIVIEVFPDGTSKTEAHGFVGNTCTLATREIELALSGGDASAVSDKKKPDFYATLGQTNNLHN